MKHALPVLLAAALTGAASAQPVGERPAVETHLNQGDIDAGRVALTRLIEHGLFLFEVKFNTLDGRGRPMTTGGSAQRSQPGPDFSRISGPEASSCKTCHNDPHSGGGGDFTANIFTQAELHDPVLDTTDPALSNERSSLGMMGSGPIEMLAREMTIELIATREQARAAAAATLEPVTLELLAKGVYFGRITVLPNGKIDPSEIEGVDWDLIIKPFQQKGVTVSLREFSNTSMNQHLGMQSTERFGLFTDPDGDGVMNELTVGDITALTIYQSTLAIPVQVMPKNKAQAQIVQLGASIFRDVGCAQCHVPEFQLHSRHFSEPNPFNPPGNLRVTDVPVPFRYDMTGEGPRPRLERSRIGGAIIRPFTDLKRHDLNDDQLFHFDNEMAPQGMINGFAPASDFTIAPYPRPTGEFLTRKLWDVGSSAPYGHRGDLSTITQAIHFHGGDARASRDSYFALPAMERAAVIDFLKTLQITPSK